MVTIIPLYDDDDVHQQTPIVWLAQIGNQTWLFESEKEAVQWAAAEIAARQTASGRGLGSSESAAEGERGPRHAGRGSGTTPKRP